MAVTDAPCSRAIWIWKRPTAPLAPVIRTFRPARSPPWRKVLSAVVPATGSVAAEAKLTSSGRTARRSVETATRSAQPAWSTKAATLVPVIGPEPSAAARSTIPTMSWPGVQPFGRMVSKRSSPRFNEVAWTETSASSARGRGSSTSANLNPEALSEDMTKASMGAYLLAGGRNLSTSLLEEFSYHGI